MHNGSSHELVVEAGRADYRYWADLWRYRELLYFLAWRDILVRYKQTAIGIAWALIRPLFTMIIFTVVFGRIARMPSGDVPYPILVFSALLPWQLFAVSLSECGNSLIVNSNLLTKVYFPRLIIPASTMMNGLLEFAVSLMLLSVLMAWYGCAPGPQLFFLIPFFLLACIVSFGAALWIAALNVQYRDFRYVVPFIIQAGIFISPVGFTSRVVPEEWRLLFSLNPMVGVIDGFRWSILGGHEPFFWPALYLSAGLGGIILVSGVWYFRRTERVLSEII